MFPSKGNFDLVKALNLATSLICLSVVLRKLFKINGSLKEILQLPLRMREFSQFWKICLFRIFLEFYALKLLYCKCFICIRLKFARFKQFTGMFKFTFIKNDAKNMHCWLFIFFSFILQGLPQKTLP